MGTARPTLSNSAARRLFLDRHALLERPTGPGKGDDLLNLVTRLGFVQVDSVKTVERAHHMILHARRQSYRPDFLTPLLERDRSLFEHWTHDAAVIPSEFLPYWILRFERDAERLPARWREWRRNGFEDAIENVLHQLKVGGPAGSADVGKHEERTSGGWWDWHPSKTALEYLWRSGKLAVTRRESFRKIYDLADRVYPENWLAQRPTKAEVTDWACRAALDRLGFATPKEIVAFWEHLTLSEVQEWCRVALSSGEIENVLITAADGSTRSAFARPGTADEAADLSEAPGMARILSPFDPALRDRARTERLFGFHYRIEIFVPAAKRKYGYYVFPVLEGETLIGRIDMKCQGSTLAVRKFWAEPDVKTGKARLSRLTSAIQRTARFSGMNDVTFEKGWQA